MHNPSPKFCIVVHFHTSFFVYHYYFIDQFKYIFDYTIFATWLRVSVCVNACVCVSFFLLNFLVYVLLVSFSILLHFACAISSIFQLRFLIYYYYFSILQQSVYHQCHLFYMSMSMSLVLISIFLFGFFTFASLFIVI